LAQFPVEAGSRSIREEIGEDLMRNLIGATEEEMTEEFNREQQRNSFRVSATGLDENVRLLLQYLLDRPGHCGIPMMLEGVPGRAANMGLLDIKTIWNEGRTGGRIEYHVTDAGRKALSQANASLGDRATRYVHEVKYFGNLKPVVYGYPFQWPLSAPVRRIDGSLVADRRRLQP
jgi:hypothetical protein